MYGNDVMSNATGNVSVSVTICTDLNERLVSRGTPASITLVQ